MKQRWISPFKALNNAVEPPEKPDRFRFFNVKVIGKPKYGFRQELVHIRQQNL